MTPTERIAAIRARYRKLADNQFTPAYAITDIAWLANLAEHYRAGLERIGADEPLEEGHGTYNGQKVRQSCTYCVQAVEYTEHLANCPWRQARETLETAP